jgi:hypothetical protein
VPRCGDVVEACREAVVGMPVPALENLELALVHSRGREQRDGGKEGREARAEDPSILVRALKLLAESLESVLVPGTERLGLARRAVARVDRLMTLEHFVPLLARVPDADSALWKAWLQLVCLLREVGGDELRVRMRGGFGQHDVFGGEGYRALPAASGLVLVGELLGECWFRREGLGRRLDEALSVPKKGRRKA